MVKVKSLEKTTERYVRNSVRAFLEGEKDLKWIYGVLLNSGLSKAETLPIVIAFRQYQYADPTRAAGLFAWLDSADW